ncbi:hypothetical protein [Actinomadura chokoriensis]|uniref:Uncharacterized protein n=1 Tax=Actinomadura chokoriensis TaxID=454156 RepID=A0ABV4R8Y2_9ACTN
MNIRSCLGPVKVPLEYLHGAEIGEDERMNRLRHRYLGHSSHSAEAGETL